MEARGGNRGTAKALTYAIAVHLIAFGLLLASFHFSRPAHVYAFRAAPKPLVGELVNSRALAQAQAQIAQAQAEAKAQAQAKLQAKARAVTAAQAKAQGQAAAKAQARAKLEAKAEAVAKSKAEAVAKARAQTRAEAAAAAERAIARAQRVLAQKQARIDARRTRIKAEHEAQRRARRVHQLQQELAAQQQANRSVRAQDALQKQLAAAAAAQRQAQAVVQQAMVNKYYARIQRKVSVNWTRPPGGAAGLRCVVQVQLLPQGDVLSVRIVDSSGDPAFDRSVEAAVYRASPLPVPHDSQLAQDFGQITFTFKPGQ